MAQQKGVISLGYHDIVAPGAFQSSGFAGGDADRYKLEEREFEEHLQAIQAAGVQPASVRDPAAATGVYLTFDDGGAGAWPCATLLERYGWRGYFFIPTDWIGKPGFLEARQIAELHQRGHAIGSHSCSHPARMSHESPEKMAREWEESARVLEQIIGEPVTCGSVPGGYYSGAVGKAAAGAGYRVLFTSEPQEVVGSVAGCLILGRYAIMRGMPAESAAAIARGSMGPRWRQYLYWNFKKAVKTVGGEYWLAFRKRVLSSK